MYKNHVIILGSSLEIWENAEWLRSLAHPVYILYIPARRVS